MNTMAFLGNFLTGVIAWLLCAIYSSKIAASKGRSAFTWFFLGLLFGPFAFFASIGAARVANSTSDRTHAHCPMCREMIRRDARICRYCGTHVVPTPYRPRSFFDGRSTQDTMGGRLAGNSALDR